MIDLADLAEGILYAVAIITGVGLVLAGIAFISIRRDGAWGR